MGIFDGIEDEQIRRGPECSVSAVIRQLDPDDAAAFVRVLDNRDVRATVIVERLARAGVKVHDGALRRHRRGLCACPRP